MRIRGGTAGLLAAIASGRIDPFDPWLPEERVLKRLAGSDLRAVIRRRARRAKHLATRLPF